MTILLTPRAVEKSPPAGDETPATPKTGEGVPEKETVPQKSGAKQKVPESLDSVILRQLLEENWFLYPAKLGVSENSVMANIGRRYLGATDINFEIRNTEIVQVAKSLYKDLDSAD